MKTIKEMADVKFNKNSFTEIAFNITNYILSIKECDDKDAIIDRCTEILEIICMGWVFTHRLIQHINLKIQYNESREYHHGNKRC